MPKRAPTDACLGVRVVAEIHLGVASLRAHSSQYSGIRSADLSRAAGPEQPLSHGNDRPIVLLRLQAVQVRTSGSQRTRESTKFELNHVLLEISCTISSMYRVLMMRLL